MSGSRSLLIIHTINWSMSVAGQPSVLPGHEVNYGRRIISMYVYEILRPCLHITFFSKNGPLLFSIVSIDNRQNGLSPILSAIHPTTTDTMLTDYLKH